MSDTNSPRWVLHAAAEISSAYARSHRMPASELASLIRSIAGALSDCAAGKVTAKVEAPTPATSIRSSVFPNHIVCLDCGESLTMLRRHLRICHEMSRDEYRAKWKLPPDYPLVAPNYAKLRRQLAKQSGLGQRLLSEVSPASAGKRPRKQSYGSGFDGSGS